MEPEANNSIWMEKGVAWSEKSDGLDFCSQQNCARSLVPTTEEILLVRLSQGHLEFAQHHFSVISPRP